MSFSKQLKAKAHKTWEDGYLHPFVQELGKGTLKKERFQFYLLQDYLYLLEYAKVFALGVVKSTSEETMARLSATQYSILNEEMNIHRKYMADFGINHEQVSRVTPSLYNRTYTANMLAVGQTGDLAEILATVLPCAWTYYDYATRLKHQYADNLQNNYYKTWIESYANNDFAMTFDWFFSTIDDLVKGKTEAQKKRIENIFISSVEFEYLFWDMAYKQELSYKL